MKNRKPQATEALPAATVTKKRSAVVAQKPVEALSQTEKELQKHREEKISLETLVLKKTQKFELLNRELIFQNQEKEKRAAELAIANKELAFQNQEKEKRAAELVIANTELAFQNREKEKRAEELIIANNELAFQNDEKEKRAKELIAANKELQVFAYISSHDLKEPLRKIQIFAALLEKEATQLSASGKEYLQRTQAASRQMTKLVEALHFYSQINLTEYPLKKIPISEVVDDVKLSLSEDIAEKNAIIQIGDLCTALISPVQFTQVLWHLIDNGLKFSRAGVPPVIVIRSRIATGARLQKENPDLDKRQLSETKDYCHISYSDNGVGFEPIYRERIFDVFQRLHAKEAYPGTGIGLSIVKKIIQHHNGCITATGTVGKGARFDIYVPAEQH